MVTAALVSDTLQSIGAVGGLLSIVGTGLLILLVASQSRQIRAMREWIEQEPQRQAETAQRVIAEVQRRIAAARERREGVVPGSAPAVSAAGAAVKPAPGTLGATPEAQKIAAEKAALAAGADATSIAPPVPTNPLAPGGVEPPRFAPLTPAGEAAVEGEPAVVSETLGQETQVSDVLPDDDFQVPAVPAGRGDDARYGDDQFDLEEEHPRGNRLLFGGGIAIVVIGIILLATQLFGGGSKSPSTADSGSGSKPVATPKPTPKPGATTATAPARSDVPVLVFNATTTTGLGKNNSDALQAKGYQIVGPPQTWSPSLTSTSIMYRPNFKAAAVEVAKDLGYSSSVVAPIDANTSAQAGQAAKVVVKAVRNPAGTTPAGTTTG
ncbi:MAG: LytR C-terminal domain-containing protein [Solirubrobacteraceae bacterium]|nr:LytR C-terminal domain-containing protein [Patulibacter sp.]